MKTTIIAAFAALVLLTFCQGHSLLPVKLESDGPNKEEDVALVHQRERRDEDAVDTSGLQERQLIVIHGQAGSGGNAGGGRRPGGGNFRGNGNFRGQGNGNFRGPGNGPFRGPGGNRPFRGPGNGNFRGPGNRPFRGPGRGWRNPGQGQHERDDLDYDTNQGGGGGGGGGGVGVCILCIGLRNNPGSTVKPEGKKP